MNKVKAIDFDQRVTFDALRRLPPLSDLPRQPDLSALWRWVTKGILIADGSRVKLRAQRVGRFLYTCPRWISEFLDATAQGRAQQPGAKRPRTTTPTPRPRSPQQRQRDRERAQRVLASI